MVDTTHAMAGQTTSALFGRLLPGTRSVAKTKQLGLPCHCLIFHRPRPSGRQIVTGAVLACTPSVWLVVVHVLLFLIMSRVCAVAHNFGMLQLL